MYLNGFQSIPFDYSEYINIPTVDARLVDDEADAALGQIVTIWPKVEKQDVGDLIEI